MRRAGAVWARVGVLLWLLAALPSLRHALQATMTAQMLVQIPLLILVGWLVSGAIPRRIVVAFAHWDGLGLAGPLLATFVGAVWMLPRTMDASVSDSWMAAAKFASVPLLVGLPAALSWPRAGFVVRGVLLLELTATAFRLGWLYLVSPERLCSNFLMGDQQRLGMSLLGLGVTACFVLAWRLIWGHIRVDPPSSVQASAKSGAARGDSNLQRSDERDAACRCG